MMDWSSQIFLFLSFLFTVSTYEYSITTRVRTVTVTHRTGDGRWHSSHPDDFYFTLVGSKGETSEHLCRANRESGEVGSCQFEDTAKVGRLRGVRIRNRGNDFWAVVHIEVDMNGVKKGIWDGWRGVGKFKTAFVGFESLHAIPGALVMPMQDLPVTCTSGNYMTHQGCQECGKNTFSGDGASSCTSCPDGKVSPAGAKSEDDCKYEQFPTCDCWTPECGYCSKLDCTVKQDFINAAHGIEVLVHSELKWRKYSSIVLFDGDGNGIGKFQWSIGRIYLTGCIQCRTPPILRKSITRKGKTSWAFSVKDRTIEIKIDGESRYKRSLTGECADVYGRVKRFAFLNVGCSNTFSYVPSEMELGSGINADCSGRCSNE